MAGKVVRLTDLTPDQQRVVLALIDAAKASPEPLPSPEKRSGAALDKEKVHG